MANKSSILRTIGLSGILLLGLNSFLPAESGKVPDSTKMARMEHWKQSPHSFLMGCGTLMAPEAHKVYTKMALSASLLYHYDIPWKHRRTNFFIMTGAGYKGCRRDGRPYRAKNDIVYENYIYDNLHIYFGAGLKVRLAYFLELSFAAAIDGAVSYEFGRYPSFYGTGISYPLYDDKDGSYRINRKPAIGGGFQGLFSIFLTYEIKNFQIFAGCQAYVGYLDDLDPIDPKAMPYNSWAIFGLGYRF